MPDARLSPNLRLVNPQTGLLTAEGFRYLQAITQLVSGGGTFQPLSPILTGLSGMGTGTGLVAQSAAASFLKRTLTGSSPILIANGDGVAGNPTFSGDIASNAEAIAGTDTTKIIVPSSLAAALASAGGAYQPLDADLTAIAALISAANKLAYATGAGTWALTDFTAFARTILDDANAAAVLATIGAQPLDTDLTAIAALVSAADKLPYATGAGTWSLADFTAAGRAILDDADATAQRATLGLVIGTNVQAFDADLAALSANATDGFWAHTGAGTGAARTLANTAPVQITNPAGIAGNPTISVDASTTAASGIVELATSAETITGTDTVRAVTPAGAAAAYQPLDSDLTSWAGVTRAAGYDTFAATPSSANLAALLTDETGTGANVFATNASLTTPFITGPAVVGHNAALAHLGVTPDVQIDAASGFPGQSISCFSSTAGHGGLLVFYRSKSGVLGTATVVASGDLIGEMLFVGAQQTGTFSNQSVAAGIRAYVANTVTSGAGGDMPGRLNLGTTPDGSATLTDRIIIDENGFSSFIGSIGRGAPVTKTADFTVATTENYLINNKAAATCTATLPAAATFTGREITIKNIQAFTVVSASANVIPLAGGAAATAILAATAGKWAKLVSNGTNWEIMAGN